MPGYLDHYGEGEEQRIKIWKGIALSLATLLIVGGAVYWTFKNYRQEKQVKSFFELLQKHDYKQAYELWGCTDAKPCKEYPFNEFMKDWGPQSPRADIGSYKIARSRSCGSGVIITADFGKDQQEKLWVERKDLTIGFSPLPGCPAGP